MSKFGCNCGATWGGLRMEHCDARGCHQTFSGTTLGDQHRPVGGPCLTPDQMRDKGWRLIDDVWRGPAMTDEQLAKRIGRTA